MPITIPDDPRIEGLAEIRGFDSVDEFVAAVLASELEGRAGGPYGDPVRASNAEGANRVVGVSSERITRRRERLDQSLARIDRLNVAVGGVKDDRESLYADDRT